YKVGRRCRRQLRAHARRSQVSDTGLKVWRLGLWGVRRYVFGRPERKYMANGGAIIAVVGGDGAGKSTAVDALYTLLSKDFATIKLHLGKPTWCWTTFPLKGLLKVGRWLGVFSNRKVSVRSLAKAPSSDFPGYAWVLWHVLTARDRYHAYLKARRFATNGGVVICDRYPLPQIRFMDGGQTCHLVTARGTKRLLNFLIGREQKFYQQILPPDVLIVLKVEPEIAVERRPDEEAEWVRNRCQEIGEFDWQQTSAQLIDAGKPKAEALVELKSLVWSKL
ncbi:MAG: hypothetical protein ACREXR_18340, partial [Gammaproteobacteria bacterium]